MAVTLPAELQFKQFLEEEDSDDRSKITEFTWDVGIKLFEEIMGDKRKSEMYFLNGEVIRDEEYLKEITVEVCREFGLSLLDVVTDLVLPIGYGYPSLANSLEGLLDDALKPISKLGKQKIIVWIQDEYWKDSSTSIIEPFMRQLLMSRIEPFLLAPLKYFDKEIFAAVTKGFQFSNIKEEDKDANSISSDPMIASETDASWKIFAMLVKFSFLLSIRSSNAPSFIVMHLSQSVAEKINAFELLELAEREGHTVKYLKNFKEVSYEQRLKTVDIVVSKIVHEYKAGRICKEGAVGVELGNANILQEFNMNGEETPGTKANIQNGQAS